MCFIRDTELLAPTLLILNIALYFNYEHLQQDICPWWFTG
jgi:hypothetical protein